MKTIRLTPDQMKLCEEWKKAKDAEEQWQVYRRSLGENLLQSLKETIEMEMASLHGTEKLTTEMSLGGELNLKIGNELKIGEAQALQFVSHFPHLINVAFKAKYAPVARVTLNMMLTDQGPAGNELRQICEVKPVTPSLTKAK